MKLNSGRPINGSRTHAEGETQHGGDDTEPNADSSPEVVGCHNESALAVEILDAADRIGEAEAAILDVVSAQVERRREERLIEGSRKQDKALLSFFSRA